MPFTTTLPRQRDREELRAGDVLLFSTSSNGEDLGVLVEGETGAKVLVLTSGEAPAPYIINAQALPSVVRVVQDDLIVEARDGELGAITGHYSAGGQLCIDDSGSIFISTSARPGQVEWWQLDTGRRASAAGDNLRYTDWRITIRRSPEAVPIVLATFPVRT